MSQSCRWSRPRTEWLLPRFERFRCWAPASMAGDWIRAFTLVPDQEELINGRVKRGDVRLFDEATLEDRFEHVVGNVERAGQGEGPIQLDDQGSTFVQDIEVARRLGQSLHHPNSLGGRRGQADAAMKHLPNRLDDVAGAIERRCQLRASKFVGPFPTEEVRALKDMAIVVTCGFLWQFTPFVWWMCNSPERFRIIEAGVVDPRGDLELVLFLLEHDLAEPGLLAKPNHSTSRFRSDLPTKLRAMAMVLRGERPPPLAPAGTPISAKPIPSTVQIVLWEGAELSPRNISLARSRTAYLEAGGNVATALVRLNSDNHPVSRSTFYNHLKRLDELSPNWRTVSRPVGNPD